MISWNKIGIKDYYRIIKRNIKNCYKNTKQEINSTKFVSNVVCELNVAEYGVYTLDDSLRNSVSSIRQTAANKYNK
jgi:hypothetical protein